MPTPRRSFLVAGSALITSTFVEPLSSWAAQAKVTKRPEEDEDVSTNEDLMREHGVLNRVLLICDDGIRRISRNEKFDTDVITKSAELIKRFIEDYHEKLEENHLFPRFEKAGKLVDLVKTLRAQHAAGRNVTDRVLASVKARRLSNYQRVAGSFRAHVSPSRST
ncbi:MAG TPA: hemerythrin domain-containing protein [Terriglobales bacterium]